MCFQCLPDLLPFFCRHQLNSAATSALSSLASEIKTRVMDNQDGRTEILEKLAKEDR